MTKIVNLKRAFPLVESALRADYNGGDGGEPPMELNERVATLEAIIPTLSTKADLADLRAEMHEGFAGMVKWIVGSAMALGAVGITVITFVLNNAVPKAFPQQVQQPPIIIQVPTAPPPVAPAAK